MINATAANQSGILASGDVDCAQSAPNAIRSIMERYANPSVIRSNATALNAIGMSEYFDLISLTLKPLGPGEDWPYMMISAWELDGKEPVDVQELGIGWAESDKGFFEPWELEPRMYIYKWGEKVNYIELAAYSDEGEPLQFAIDNMLLGLHEL